MKRDQFTITDISGNLGDAKLAHYNAWLLDPKRASGSVYPGFPADKVVAAPVKEVAPEVAKIKRAKKVAKEVVVEATKKKSVKKGSKIDVAMALYKEFPALSRNEMVAMIAGKLNVTQANAAVYLYNVKKKI